jgi:hypothetical protein
MSAVPATPQSAPLSEQHFSPVETVERQLSTACRRLTLEVNDVAAVGVGGGGGLGGGLGRRGRGGGLGCEGGGGAFVVLIVAVSDTLSYLNVTERSVSNVSAAHISTRNWSPLETFTG